MKVLFTGGGTMGSVSPLLAIHEELISRDSKTECLFIGTQEGPERAVVESLGVKFVDIPSGRLRRFFSLKNFTDPFRVIAGGFKARKIIKEFKPDVVLTAGSFVSYPVAKAASKLNIPVFVHQQDIEVGLANKMMAKFARVITITFDESISKFDYKKTFFTSNPVMKSRIECLISNSHDKFGLDKNKKIIFIMGGGTGAEAINRLTVESLGELTKNYQVVHATGVGKSLSFLIKDFFDRETRMRIKDNYFEFEYINEGMCEILSIADVVVSRAGLSSLTELALLGKPSIIIPIPDSHQEKNSEYFSRYNAVINLSQKELTSEIFTRAIMSLSENEALKKNLENNIKQLILADAAKRYVDLIYSVVNKM